MIALKLSALLQPGSYSSLFDAETIEITGVSDHTADISPGHLFIAVKGAHFDPHNIMSCILRAGISALVTEERDLSLPEDLPVFFVEDIRAAQADIWHRFYGQPAKKMRMIAVTGTNGKTTTARILCHLLNVGGLHSGYIGTLGIFDGDEVIKKSLGDTMTTPDPRHLYHALRVLADRGVDYTVLEVSSHAIVGQRISPLAFELGLFTNLSEEHLDFHHDMETYFAAKAALFTKCKKGIFNRDDSYGERLYAQAPCEGFGCGIVHSADFSAVEPNETEDGGTNYIHQTPFGLYSIHCPLVGSFNVYNSLLAATAALILGVCPSDLMYGMCTLPTVPGRMETLELSDLAVDFRVMIDYAHTPLAMKEAIKAARRQTEGRLIVLFGAGGERDREKRHLMGEIAEALADFVYVTSDNTRGESPIQIFKDILSGIKGTGKHRVISDRRTAIKTAIDALEPKDTLLLLGKGHEEYDWNADGIRPFSEKEIVREHLLGMRREQA